MNRLIEKFVETGSVGNAKHTGRPKTSRSNINIKTVRESDENSGTSIRRRGQEYTNFKKLSTAYIHERFVSLCLQNSINTTEA